MNLQIGDAVFIWLAAIMAFVAVIGTYLLPALLAFMNRKIHRNTIGLITLFLGWTVIGWIACFIWALMDRRAATDSVRHGDATQS